MTKPNIRNWKVSEKLLDFKTSVKYGEQKWVLFCRELLKRGYHVRLTEAKTTSSKYIRIYFNFEKGQYLEVRFSDHLPNEKVETTYSSDLYVGHSRSGILTYQDALKSVITWVDGINNDNITLFSSWRRKDNVFLQKIIDTKSSTSNEIFMADLILKIRSNSSYIIK